MSFPEYTAKSRFPKLQPKGFCRGCRGPIKEKRRITWCSKECEKKFHPFHVKRAVRERDKVCQICSGPAFTHREMRRRFQEDYAEFLVRQKFQKQHREEYDHILPHSEGGLFTLENIRLMCAACHKKRTADWHKQRAAARKAATPTPDAPPPEQL